MKGNFIPPKLYARFRKSMPILCVDVVVRTPKGVLLGVRDQPPVKRVLWLIGGRVLFGETPEQAAVRKVREETGLKVRVDKLVGFYTIAFTKGEIRHNIAIDFVATQTGGKLRLTKEYSSFTFAKKMPKKLHPYVRHVLSDSGVFGGAKMGRYKKTPYYYNL